MSPHAPYLVGYQYAEEEEGAGNADTGEKEIKRFLKRGNIRFSDRPEIDENAESEPEEETEQFYHLAMISHPPQACQPRRPVSVGPDFFI
jgi:hypothetical protein